MKRMVCMAIGVLLLVGVSMASGQSLGEVARSTRKGKTQQSPANRHFDNDNLPKGDHLSVVGPAPAASANDGNQTGDVNGQGQPAQAAPNSDPKAAAEERQKAADDWKKKIDEQKKKVESLSHELELTRREYRLRAVAMYSDAGSRLRNAAMWDKEDADFKKQIDEQQKAVEAARQELEDLKEQARKAGAPATVRE
ncbi:MAG: hypothetical protein HY233_00455 [Acidobacteriales bacterium]|nr:hypothetical protein [Candidatus Koribacter versatilis]MBI3644430.1 hypothetical protein [Terriglobales bacterium]